MPYAFSSNGQQGTRLRGMRLTDPDLLAEYGDGLYPMKWVYEKGELHANGNYREPPGIEVRKGVCGDPRQDSLPVRFLGFGICSDEIFYFRFSPPCGGFFSKTFCFCFPRVRPVVICWICCGQR